MLGLSIRERLIKTVQNASVNAIPSYKAAIINAIRKDKNISEEIVQRIAFEYHRRILNATLSVFETSSPNIHTRFSLAIASPLLCGYEIEPNQPHMAGSIYAMAYWAMTNKTAKPKDFTALNHWQADIMDKVLCEIDTELSE